MCCCLTTAHLMTRQKIIAYYLVEDKLMVMYSSQPDLA